MPAGGSPAASDFQKYTNTKITGNDFNYNIDKFITQATTPGASGYEFTLKKLTATDLVGDISQCTGFPSQISNLVADGNLQAGELVQLAGGKAKKADSTTAAGVDNIIGFVTANVTDGNTATIETHRYAGLSGLVVDTTYYATTAGGITSVAPTFKRVVGVADTTTSLLVRIVNDNAGGTVGEPINTLYADNIGDASNRVGQGHFDAIGTQANPVDTIHVDNMVSAGLPAAYMTAEINLSPTITIHSSLNISSTSIAYASWSNVEYTITMNFTNSFNSGGLIIPYGVTSDGIHFTGTGINYKLHASTYSRNQTQNNDLTDYDTGNTITEMSISFQSYQGMQPKWVGFLIYGGT